MARQSIFSAPTKLWHPVQGWFTFGIGEQDPGGAWFEKEGGEIAGSSTTAQALKDLVTAQDQIEQRDTALASKDHDLAQAAAAREEAEARVEGLVQAQAKAKAERDALKDELATSAEAHAEALRAQAGLKERITELETDIANANQRAADASALAESYAADAHAAKDALAKFDGDKDGKPGGKAKRGADSETAPAGE